MKREHLRRLKIGVTYHCNGLCKHCAMADYPRIKEDEISLQEIDRLVDVARRAGVRAVVIFGGEPTLRRDLLDIVKTAARHIPNVILDSNGYLLNEERIRALKEAGLVRMQISIDGPDRETHAKIRGMDRFDTVVNAIRLSVQAGLEVHLLTTATRPLLQNDGLPRLIALGRELGVDGFRFLFPALSGRWSDDTSVLLTPEEKAYVMEHIDGQFVYLEDEGQDCHRCGAIFRGFLYVTPYGEVMPCYFVPLLLGSIREEPFTDIARRAYGDIAWLRKDRVFMDRPTCIMGDLRSQVLFGHRSGTLLPVPRDNVIDLGGGGDAKIGGAGLVDPRPPRESAAIRSDIESRSDTFSHVTLTGGELVQRQDLTDILATLRARELAFSIVSDASLFADADTLALLADGDVRRVVVPVKSAAGADLPGVTVSEETLARLSEGATRLYESEIPLEFVLCDVGAADQELLHALLALGPDQITNVITREAPDDEHGPLDSTLPWLGSRRVVRRELVAYRGAFTDDAPCADDGLNPRAYTRLDEVLAQPSRGGSETVRVAVMRDSLSDGMDQLEQVVRRLADEDRRLELVCVGGEDLSSHEQRLTWEHFQNPTTQKELERLDVLARRFPEAFAHRGFGAPLFRPWTRPRDIAELFQRLKLDREETASALRLSLLTDARPPAPDSEKLAPIAEGQSWTKGAYGHLQVGWRFADPVAARLHAVLLATALCLENEKGAGRDDIGRMLAALPSENRSLSFVASRVIAAIESPDATASISSLLEFIATSHQEDGDERDGTEDDDKCAGGEASGEEIRPGSSHPEPEPDRPPRTPLAKMMAENEDLVRRVFESVGSAPKSPLPGWGLQRFQAREGKSGFRFDATMRNGTERLVVSLFPSDEERQAYVAAGRVKLAHPNGVPLPRDVERRALGRLCRLVDHYLGRASAQRSEKQAGAA